MFRAKKGQFLVLANFFMTIGGNVKFLPIKTKTIVLNLIISINNNIKNWKKKERKRKIK